MKKPDKQTIRKFQILGLFLLLFAIFKGVFVLFILMILSFSMSWVVNNFKLRKFGFELATFTGVLAAVKFGPLWGAVIAVVLVTYHLVAGGFFGAYMMWVIPAYAVGAALAGIFPGLDILMLGMLVTIGINTNNVIWTALTSPGFLANYMIYVVTNIGFNFVLFAVLGGPLRSLIV